MKPTHLLIPIKDIEGLNVIDITILHAKSKQISLNEDDIEQKAHISYSDGREDKYTEGYQQALKDLLK